MTILVDLDDTVWYLLQPWLDYLNKKYKLNVQLNDIKQWDLKYVFPTLKEAQIYAPLSYESFWRKYINPIPGAIDIIKKLYSEGHDIFFITATVHKNVPVKAELVKRYFSFIPIENLIIAHNKDMIKGDIIIDDNIENVKNRSLSILFTAPHNDSECVQSYCNEQHTMYRADSWQEIYDYIHNLSKV